MATYSEDAQVKIFVLNNRQILLTKDGNQEFCLNIKKNKENKTVEFMELEEIKKQKEVVEGEKGDDFAGKIIRWGFEWAFLNNLTIIPTSKHVMEFIKKSPHFIKLCKLTEELK